MRHSIRAIHFIGIGGAGMAGLAEVMAGMGYRVSGSDSREQRSLARLRARGIAVHIGHRAEQVQAADCVVYSSAIAADNVERVVAVQNGIPTVPRAQMLGELMRFKPGIAIAGTHGKTTVSSMVAHVLTSAGLSPTCVIGGQLLSAQDGELIGSGEHVVVEADESDASFLHLQPVIAVVTNIDDDHLEAFGDDLSQLSDAFMGFLANLPFYGTAVICSDNAAAAAVAEKVQTRRVVRYGLADGSSGGGGVDISAVDISAQVDGMRYTLIADGERYPITIGALGRHNVQNSLAAVAVALELGVPMADIQTGLQSFSGVARRLQFYGDIKIADKQALLVDDYAHHPSEISVTLQALAAAYPSLRLLLVFQSHRYSRTARLLPQLAQALAAADSLIVLPIYPAGENAPQENLYAALLTHISTDKAACERDQLDDMLRQKLQYKDLLVCMGAGDIGTLPGQLWEQYRV